MVVACGCELGGTTSPGRYRVLAGDLVGGVTPPDGRRAINAGDALAVVVALKIRDGVWQSQREEPLTLRLQSQCEVVSPRLRPAAR